mmetsp:Transcript_27433/g.87913  ORF Transcript_27433/g.87913 Transcript_27433/m.87913 type:complete len:414 (+) Transcript_27433:1162-2403(+)
MVRGVNPLLEQPPLLVQELRLGRVDHRAAEVLLVVLRLLAPPLREVAPVPHTPRALLEVPRGHLVRIQVPLHPPGLPGQFVVVVLQHAQVPAVLELGVEVEAAEPPPRGDVSRREVLVPFARAGGWVDLDIVRTPVLAVLGVAVLVQVASVILPPPHEVLDIFPPQQLLLHLRPVRLLDRVLNELPLSRVVPVRHIRRDEVLVAEALLPDRHPPAPRHPNGHSELARRGRQPLARQLPGVFPRRLPPSGRRRALPPRRLLRLVGLDGVGAGERGGGGRRGDLQPPPGKLLVHLLPLVGRALARHSDDLGLELLDLGLVLLLGDGGRRGQLRAAAGPRGVPEFLGHHQLHRHVLFVAKHHVVQDFELVFHPVLDLRVEVPRVHRPPELPRGPEFAAPPPRGAQVLRLVELRRRG